MPVESNASITDLAATQKDANDAQAGDLSGGVTLETGNVSSFTVFLDANGAVDITVEFSPDGGSNWYEPAAESPVEFGSAGTDLVQIEYNAEQVRLTASNTTDVKAQVRGVV